MQFAQPIWILAGIASCTGFVLFLIKMHRNRQARLEKFACPQLAARLTRHVSPRLRLLKSILLVLAIFFLFLTLARPQYGHRWVDVKRKGIDILFGLDTSRSMLAEDTKPNRLERAKLGILDFISKLEGDRIGLMPFAGSPYLMTPLTLDYIAFQSSLKAIDTNIIPHGGTNIGSVIEEAERVLENDANHKILILLTDGENLEGDALAAASKAKERGMSIYTVGVGTAEGELIPANGGGAGFVKGPDNRYITSKLDDTVLKEIAEATEALYTPLGTSGQGLEEIYRQKLSLIPKDELMEKRSKIPVERFGWPLTAAIVLLILEYLVPERKSARRLSLPSVITSGRRPKKTMALLLLASSSLSLAAVHNARASENTQAFEAYNGGEFISAAELYSEALSGQPDNPDLHYNYGTSAYKNNMYDDAVASFTQSLKGSPLPLQEKAYYNRGNAYYKKGEEMVQANPQATAEEWRQAVDSFDSALRLNGENSLARQNRAFVQKKLEELQKQMEQEQQKSQDQQQDEDGQEKDSPPRQEQNDRNNEGDKPEDTPQNNNGQQDEDSPQEPQKQNEQDPEKGEGREQDSSQQEGAHASQANENADVTQSPRPVQEEAMSREEAENLLNAMKNEESDLNFIPNLPPGDSGRNW